MRHTPFPRLSAKTGEVDPGTDLACWGCKIKINVKRGYFRCNYTACDYDVGTRCGLVADLEWTDDEEPVIDDAGILNKQVTASEPEAAPEEESKVVPKVKQASLSDKCPKGHPLTVW